MVIPVHNGAETLGATLRSLLDQEFDHPVEILIVDDSSTDQSVEICKSLGLEVVRNDTNIGLAASLNRGIALSKNRIVVTLHHDVIPLSKDWLKRLIAPLSEADVGASCSVQHPPDAAAALSFWEDLLWCRVGPHHALNNKADAYKKDVLERVGIFDQSRFRTAGEDEDMALRLRLFGLRVASSSGEVIHNHNFGHDPKGKTLGKILSKEYSFGRAGGALRRKFVGHVPGAYVYPIPKSPIHDGLFRVVLCVGVFIPVLQWICLPGLVASSFLGIGVATKRIRGKPRLAVYPFFNLIRYWSYTVGYVGGLVLGTQR